MKGRVDVLVRGDPGRDDVARINLDQRNFQSRGESLAPRPGNGQWREIADDGACADRIDDQRQLVSRIAEAKLKRNPEVTQVLLNLLEPVEHEIEVPPRRVAAAVKQPEHAEHV